VELYLHCSNTPSWRGARLKKAQGQLYLYLYWKLNSTPDDYILVYVTVVELSPVYIATRKNWDLWE
jgi:hypothetical protein